jgi:hypothetical protein
MSSSLGSINEFKAYIDRLNCSSFYVEFNDNLDTDAQVSFSSGNTDEWFIIISSEKLILPETKFSTNQYNMIYIRTTDTLEIEIDNQKLFIQCD